ncbi:hypothetical protein L2E82_38893 [Cichorium intybus]|uniref:Uncharacterized protein n=1 Tax=Cichorium intybus TaxID=13427 RepID=A0ACB9AHQ1_CICIN|nr:hypothetical protein L2E82_38893 [Cichorium intybus]
MMGVNLRHVNIPHQQSPSQIYSEMESPWSPAYYSPRHDFPNSPSSSRYHTPYSNILHGNGTNVNLGHTHGVYPDGNHGTPHYVHHGIFHDRHNVHTPHAYGAENLYHPSSHGHVPANGFWRNGQSQKQENVTPENVQITPEVVTKLEEKDGFGKEKLNGGENCQENNVTVLETEKIEAHTLSNVPQDIESLHKSEIEVVKDVKTESQNDGIKEETVQELEAVDVPADLEVDSESDNQNNTKIEQTIKAEEEATAREIRELGTGTYGAVYHGKWKGSDVAIKRIKASCFAGKPSERKRLIADFWKEAFVLSSLHHPNVVSFYGIVRCPDGSLATVTEFMVNGSLKQFLQKKDRTIDRRKRLIIAMDASFGMEYLHGKSIVHFDLKCENLLVNMRDSHRPICKIGDLGLSKVKQHTLLSGGVRGTLPWMTPELLSGKSHMVSEKIDVYSFGIVMWELLTGDFCWSSDPTETPSFSEISQKLRTMAAAINVK